MPNLLRLNPKAKDWIGLGARLILGGVLLVAGALKVDNLPASVLAVRAYKLLPFELTTVVGYALPILEIVVGLLLIVGLFTRISAAIGGLLMVAFIIGIASAWARGLSLDCGCFGGGGEIDPSQTQYPQEILRDLGLLALGAWSTVRPRSALSLDAKLFPEISEADFGEELDVDPAHEKANS